MFQKYFLGAGYHLILTKLCATQIIPNLQMGKLRIREMMWPVWGHTVRKIQGQDVNLDSDSSEPQILKTLGDILERATTTTTTTQSS